MLFYMIFGTNLLTRARCQFLFSLVFEYCRKGIPNGVQLTCQFFMIFMDQKKPPE